MPQNDKIGPTTNNRPSHPSATNLPQLSGEIVRDFFTYQSQEFELKKQESVSRDKELDRAHEISLRTMDVQKELLLKAPEHSFKHKCLFLTFILIVLMIIASVFIYCIYSGNKEVAMRIIETIVIIVGSGGGGYAIGKGKKSNPKTETAEVVE
ncbi:hypothetical protein SAMN05518672_102722 [Chitinophaga sp. CF118]|uniref:hypothetical protein n=1 Tax=Chitinophaga sp. CF118 TaxID=1884367 RepID=UPI0008EB41E7|nr:hypothetical protein [Chitinophaga sp. CF118]SFD63564.1 hypothetical protein SAMN05518672_102722 [Chitinophaga sp. CF118]